MPPLIQAKLLPETSKYRAISTPLPLSQASRCNPTLPRRNTESNSAKRQTVLDRVSEYSTSHTTGSPRVHSSYIPRDFFLALKTQFPFSPPSSLRQDDRVGACTK
ncbi:translocon outer membrane complex 75-III [Corchorus olitorius]|uniref:Translocon outer membrane complex 75-III n=1 Tax=Corchorus olitorius TaxID=93759 RepID=A0A1R3KEC8_9ROSI|nr:translocon outer membrane complex 75-III [Corchorus olitorius]